MSPEFVFDGVPEAWPDRDVIIIGGSRDAVGISLDTNPAAFRQPDQETVGISCVIICVGGDTSIKPIRERAFAHYGTFAQSIRGNNTLGGAVSFARMSSAQVAQYLDGQTGGSVEITFVVSCTTFI